MSNETWRLFFTLCTRVLGQGRSRCAWTTFASLSESLHYWSAAVPAESELGVIGTNDGGTWGQPFTYQSLAHVIIPREFYWEHQSPSGFSNGTKQQDLQFLSRELESAGVPHRVTELVLEVKLY